MVRARRPGLTPRDIGFGQILLQDLGDPRHEPRARKPARHEVASPRNAGWRRRQLVGLWQLCQQTVDLPGSITPRLTPSIPSTRKAAATRPGIGTAPCRSAMTAPTAPSSQPGGCPQMLTSTPYDHVGPLAATGSPDRIEGHWQDALPGAADRASVSSPTSPRLTLTCGRSTGPDTHLVARRALVGRRR